MTKLTYKHETDAPALRNFELNSEAYKITLQGVDEDVLRIDLEAEVKFEDVSEDIIKEIMTFELNGENLEMQLKRHPKIKNGKIRIEIPKQCNLEITGKSGSFEVRDFTNSFEIENQHGKIALYNVIGDSEIRNQNGAIYAENHQGNLEVSNTNGAIQLKKCQGEMQLHSTNGVIRLSGCNGDLECTNQNGMIQVSESSFKNVELHNQNGPIYYEFAPIEEGNFEFENSNGRIQLIIPESIPYKLEAKTQMGKLNIALPGEYDQSNEDGYKTIEMQKGSGKVQISATNRMGGIILSDSPRKETKFSFDKEDLFDGKKLETEITEAINSGLSEMKSALKSLNTINLPEPARNIMDKIKHKMTGTPAEPPVPPQEVNQPTEKMEQSRMKILELLQAGTISVDDAGKLLEALEG